jgi:ABC-type sugar transport system ATPase subunit
MLSIHDLSATHRLRELNLAVAAGERLVLLGPTGSGKTTLLRLIIGLDTPTRGEILLEGKRLNDVPPHERGIAFVPQRPALYPHLAVWENLVASVVKGRRRSDAFDPPTLARLPVEITKAAALLKITHLLGRMPNELSGGEKQRVALARAVLSKARLWLLDEPFAPLDPLFRSEFHKDLLLLLDSSQATMILVSHDPVDALALGRLIGVLDDGRLQQLGTAGELKARPGSRFVEAVAGQF